MKKKLVFLLMAGMLTLNLTACGEKLTPPTAPPNETQNFEEQIQEVVENPLEDLDPQELENVEKISFTDYNTKLITTQQLEKEIEDKSTFYLYIEGANNLSFDYASVENAIKTLEVEYGIPVEFYTIQEDDITNEDKTILARILGEEKNVADIFNANVEIEEDKIVDDLGTTFFGLYAIQNGEVVNTYDNFVLPEDQASKLSSKITNFVYESDLFQDYYGIEPITYEEVLEKIANKEKFLLYVGRDTCPYCHAFKPSLTAVLGDTELNVPVYYLYTQSYKTAINRGEDGAQETWDSLKETLGIQYTPSFVLYEQSYNVAMFDGYIASETYWDADDIGKAEQRDKTTEALRLWLETEELTAQTSAEQIAETGAENVSND